MLSQFPTNYEIVGLMNQEFYIRPAFIQLVPYIKILELDISYHCSQFGQHFASFNILALWARAQLP